MGVVASQLHQPPGVGTGQWGEPVTMTWFVPFANTWVLLLHCHITSHLVSSVGTGQWGEPVTMTWFVPFANTWVLLLHSHITSHLVSSVGTGQWGEPVIVTWFVLIITCFNVITCFLVIFCSTVTWGGGGGDLILFCKKSFNHMNMTRFIFIIAYFLLKFSSASFVVSQPHHQPPGAC